MQFIGKRGLSHTQKTTPADTIAWNINFPSKGEAMPDNDDLRMNQNETLNCKLALMGVWTEACREAAAYFGVNPDGSGNFLIAWNIVDVITLL